MSFGQQRRNYKKVTGGTFKGFVSHYHVTKKKIDCAGLDIKALLEEIK